MIFPDIKLLTKRILATEKEGSLSLSRNHTNSTAHITAKNAQLFLKPEACVFVAK